MSTCTRTMLSMCVRRVDVYSSSFSLLLHVGGVSLKKRKLRKKSRRRVVACAGLKSLRAVVKHHHVQLRHKNKKKTGVYSCTIIHTTDVATLVEALRRFLSRNRGGVRSFGSSSACHHRRPHKKTKAEDPATARARARTWPIDLPPRGGAEETASSGHVTVFRLYALLSELHSASSHFSSKS